MPVPNLKFVPGRNMGPMKQGCCRTFARILFSHVGLLIIVVIYAVGGAYMFIAMESSHEEYRRKKKYQASMEVEDSIKYLINLLWYNNQGIHTQKEYISMVQNQLMNYKNFVVKKATDSNINYDGDVTAWDYDWTVSKSLLFTVTTMAAIGYGHISPKTCRGQVATIIYSVIGIPLLLLFLANIGDFLANSFRYIYSRACCRWCRVRRKFNDLRKGKTLEKRAVWKDKVGSEKYMPTEKVNVPIMVNLCLIFMYLMMGGALFSWWEGWEMIQAIYFTFITLTTIGFGDLVPGKSFVDVNDNFKSALRMIANVVFCLFGMALLSMCINLMQEQIVNKTRWFLTEIGIIEEEIDPMEKYKYKKSQKGTVLETRCDHDGNKRIRVVNAEEGESTTVRPKHADIQQELKEMELE